jgi:hypothetical protein
VLQAVLRINRAIQRGEAANTVKELMCPEAQLPTVYPFAATVYQQELAVLQQQQQGVSSEMPGQLQGSQAATGWRTACSSEMLVSH